MAKSEIKMKMSLDTSGVKAALNRAKSNISKFASQAKAALGALVKVGIGGLVTGFGLASRSALLYGKEMLNLSALANTNFKDFQKLAEGAKTVGIQGDKLADILKDTSDKIGDFLETGGGPLADYFENIAPLIGQTADEFRGLSGADALQKYYNGIQQANLDSETMTFYMEAIASDSAALIPLLHDGGAAFTELGQAAEESGRIMQESTAESLKEASGRLDKFKQKATIWAGEIVQLLSLDHKGLFKRVEFIDFGAVSTRGLARQDEAEKIKALADAYGELPDGTDLKGLAEGLADLASNQDSFLSTDFDPSKLGEAEKLIAAASAEIDHQKGLLKEGVIDLEQYNFQHETILEILALEGMELRKNQRTEKEKVAIAKLTTKLAEEEKKAAMDALTNSEKLAELMADRVKLQQELVDGGNGNAEAELELIGHKRKILELDQEIKKAQKGAQDDQVKAGKKANDDADKAFDAAEEAREKAADAREEAIEKAEDGARQGLQSDLLDAQVAQRADIVHSIEKEIELTERIRQIREETGKNEVEARRAAEAMMKIEAGPDLNQSGFVTHKERRVWEKQQKALRKEQKDRNRQEKRDERELDRRKRGGEKAEDVLKDFAERKLKKEMDEAEKQGKDAVDDLKKARKKAEDAAGKVPKKPENAVVKALKPVLEKQLAELVQINKSLKCDG